MPNLILEESYNNLRQAINCYVCHAFLPGLCIESGDYGGFRYAFALEESKTRVFFTAWPVTIRLSDSNRESWLLELTAGDDFIPDDEPFAYLVARVRQSTRTGPLRWRPSGANWEFSEAEEDTCPATCSCFPATKIVRIEVHSVNSYAAILVTHACESRWVFYGEYDGRDWLCFDPELCDAIVRWSDECVVVVQ
jgi:hypothetical protein